MDLIHPESVVDVGCGTGAWLECFREHGVDNIMGLDGLHVPVSQLEIPGKYFRPCDLDRLPLAIDRRFDLAISLEVAEHLPGESADAFVKQLVELAPVVLFSAAICHQGGQHHVNEQWPNYWVDRFQSHAYEPFDVFRPYVWDNSEVDWWYAQNLFLFVARSETAIYSTLTERVATADPLPHCLVHPKNYEQLAWRTRALEAMLKCIAVMPPNSRVVLVDDHLFGNVLPVGIELVPFTENDGEYNGPPRDDAHAISELERMRRDSEHCFLVIGWPAFWWLDHYTKWRTYLDNNFTVCLQDEDAVVFDVSVQRSPFHRQPI